MTEVSALKGGGLGTIVFFAAHAMGLLDLPSALAGALTLSPLLDLNWDYRQQSLTRCRPWQLRLS